MAVAKIDENGRNSIIVASSSDGQTVIQAVADPVTHRLLMTTATVGNNGNNQGNAVVDENSRTAWTALSSANNGAIVEAYSNPLTGAIISRKV